MHLLNEFVKSLGFMTPSGSAEPATRLSALADALRHNAVICQEVDLRLSKLEQTLDIQTFDNALEGQRALQVHQAYTLASLQEQIDELRAGWSQHVPAFLNALSTIQAFAREQAEIKALLERVLSEQKLKDDASGTVNT